MKHLMTLMALVVAVTAGAQTGLVEFPYNPDADNDDVIGTADLLALLSLYGSEFSEESLYLNDDSLTALYYTGNMRFHSCFRSCSQLPGRWKIPDAEQIMLFDLASLNDPWVWITNPMDYTPAPTYRDDHFLIGTETTGNTGRISIEDSDENEPCYCYTHERPKVEYSVVVGQFEANQLEYDLELLSNEKTQDGWYPLGPAVTPDGAWYTQTFWRWAE